MGGTVLRISNCRTRPFYDGTVLGLEVITPSSGRRMDGTRWQLGCCHGRLLGNGYRQDASVQLGLDRFIGETEAKAQAKLVVVRGQSRMGRIPFGAC